MNRFKIGLQLYSIRDEMEKDMDATLKKVARMGYDCVEFAGFFDHSAEEVKAMCDKYGLEPVSAHHRLSLFLEDTENSVNYLNTLGVKYAAIPSVPKEALADDYENLIAKIKKAGEIAKNAGIQLLYHNHDFEFYIRRGDMAALDAIYSDISTDLLCPQLDVCWVHYSGNDPIAYIKKYGDVEEVLHLKDFECKNLASGPVYDLIDEPGKAPAGDRESSGFEFRPIGHGRQDVPAIMKTAEETSIKYVIVEQDGHPQNTSLEDAKISIDYLRSIGY